MVPELEMADEPVAVGPDVVVFGILGEHVVQKVQLFGWEMWEVSSG